MVGVGPLPLALGMALVTGLVTTIASEAVPPREEKAPQKVRNRLFDDCMALYGFTKDTR
jgi:hypothetical protein